MVYVVMGECGMYSDRSEWCVMAYADKSLAEAHAHRAEKRAKELRFDYMYSGRTGEYPRNEHDPEFHTPYYDDMSYNVVEIPFIDSPQAEARG